MGYWKNKLIEFNERRYIDTEVMICQHCIDDPFVRQLIAEYGEYGECTYCKIKNGKKARRKVIPLNLLMPFIMKYLDEYYLNAEDWGGYDSEIKGYTFTTYDSHEIAENIAFEIGINHIGLINEVARFLSDELLVLSEELYSSRLEEDLGLWNRYCNNVRELNCYSVEQIVSLCDRDNAPKNLQEISDCLYMIFSYCKELQISEYLDPTINIYRGVKHSNYPMGFDYFPASFIGTAPAIRVKFNRMSEERDMMFYGSTSKDLVLKELEYDIENKTPIIVGNFHLNKRATILNLSELSYNKKPSVLDVENKDRLNSWHFLQNFIEKISIPINKDLYYKLSMEQMKKCKNYDLINELRNKIDTEYKPTQVFTKYIQRKTNYDGISFKSSKSDVYTEKNYVLFIPNCDCLDKCDDVDMKKLQLIMEPKTENIFL